MSEVQNVNYSGNTNKSPNTEYHNEQMNLIFSFLMFTPYIHSKFLEFVKQFNEVISDGYTHIFVNGDDGLYILTRKNQEDTKDIIRDFEYLKSKINLSNPNIIVFKLKIVDVKPVCLFKRCDLFKFKNLYRYYVEFTIVNNDFQYIKPDEIIDFIIKPNIGYVCSYVKHLIKKMFHVYPFWFKCEETSKL